MLDILQSNHERRILNSFCYALTQYCLQFLETSNEVFLRESEDPVKLTLKKVIFSNQAEQRLPLEEIKQIFKSIKEGEKDKVYELDRLAKNTKILHNFYLEKWWKEKSGHKGKKSKVNTRASRGKKSDEDCTQAVIEAVLDSYTEDESSTSPQKRYPAGMFYLASRDDNEDCYLDPIPPNKALTPPSTNETLEFHFWLDTEKYGIDYQGERPYISPPHPYPIQLLVEVWSEDLSFSSERRKTLTLEYRGSTEHARFPFELDVRDISTHKETAVLFVFLLHENELLAVFRIQAAISFDSQQEAQFPMLLEHAYFDTDWFQFEETISTGPNLTIFFTKNKNTERVQIFTLNREKVWGNTGALVSEFDTLRQDIYAVIHELAHEISLQETKGQYARNKRKLFKNSAENLSRWGFNVFCKLFFEKSEDNEATLRKFGEHIGALEAGASVTIAIDDNVKNLMIPWTLIYDRRSKDEPEKDGFWGARFKLTVRYSMLPKRHSKKQQHLPLIGTVYEQSHCKGEGQKMLKVLDKLVEEKKIQPYKQLSVDEEENLKDLNKYPFDVIHFFCHGHTQLEGQLSERLKKISLHYEENSDSDYLMDKTGYDNHDSYIFIAGRKGSLNNMKIDYKSSLSATIVLMSMCESAQVSSSGTGFVSFFLERGVHAVMGTEGPIPWTLPLKMDKSLFEYLLKGFSISDSLWHVRRELIDDNVLVLIYSLYGDGEARLVKAQSSDYSY